MAIIEKAKNPELWFLISQFHWSGCGCVSPHAICVAVETKFANEQIAAMETAIICAKEIIGVDGLREFGSGDMLVDMYAEDYKLWIIEFGLQEVNTLLNEIYIEGVFQEA